MRRGCGWELGCQLFDLAVLGNPLNERRILKALKEPLAEAIDQK